VVKRQTAADDPIQERREELGLSDLARRRNPLGDVGSAPGAIAPEADFIRRDEVGGIRNCRKIGIDPAAVLSRPLVGEINRLAGSWKAARNATSRCSSSGSASGSTCWAGRQGFGPSSVCRWPCIGETRQAGGTRLRRMPLPAFDAETGFPICPAGAGRSHGNEGTPSRR